MSSRECLFLAPGSRCSHPEVGGQTDEARCASCMKYVGRPRGAGDVIHSALKAIGVPQVMEKAGVKGCGCGKRRAALNAAIPLVDSSQEKRDV